jgi:hypothetical protein
LQASSQSYEKNTNHIGSLLHLVSSQLQLSGSGLSSETTRRRSISREEEKQPRTTTLNKKCNEKQLKRSQSCTQQEKLGLKSFFARTDPEQCSV